MRRRAVIIGAGVGGLTSAIRLAQNDYEVTVVESRRSAGGLASGFEIDGLHFDAGPYVLLDRPGLEWAFRQLCLAPAEHFQLHRIPKVYQVDDGSTEPISIDGSFEATSAGFDARWPGAGEQYRRFINESMATYQRLQSMQWKSRPGLLDIIRCG
ncbi:MAG: FAD-dependent oxidoreductase, partial [Fuerstiella sp.]|nr:FAD-dependent oxidoreductase [Fuerstiella sp.]